MGIHSEGRGVLKRILKEISSRKFFVKGWGWVQKDSEEERSSP